MTRIRWRNKSPPVRRFAVVNMLLCLACLVSLGACAPRGARRKARRQRRLQENMDDANDPNNDKNNDKETSLSPSVAPSIAVLPSATPSVSPIISFSPSTTPPVAEPTVLPTLTAWPTSTPYPTVTPYPTITPSPTKTGFATEAPTVPVLAGAQGNLNLKMYVSDPTVNASDVNEGNASELLDGVLDGMLQVLCQAGNVVVLEQDVTADSICPTTRHRSLQVTAPVVWATARVDVVDEVENGEVYMYWTVVYPVLDIGSLDSGETEEEALKAINNETSLVLSDFIQDKSMDELLPDTSTAYAIDQESYDDDWTPNYDPLNPAPFHSLRIAGIALFVFTVVSSLLLVGLSSQRKNAREIDVKLAEQERGGLVTEEGLDLMLEVGRRESEKAGYTSTDVGTKMILNTSRSRAVTVVHADDECNDDRERIMSTMPQQYRTNGSPGNKDNLASKKYSLDDAVVVEAAAKQASLLDRSHPRPDDDDDKDEDPLDKSSETLDKTLDSNLSDQFSTFFSGLLHEPPESTTQEKPTKKQSI